MTGPIDAPDFHDTLMSVGSGGVSDDLGWLGMPDIQDMADRGAVRLAAAGLTPSEPVLIPVGGQAEDISAILAVIGAGGTAVPFSRKAHDTARAHLIAATGARFCLGAARTDRRGQPDLQRLSGSAPPPRPLLDGAAMITFTSGSTGQPKGVVLSRRRISAKFAAIRRAIGMTGAPDVAVPLQLQFSFGQWATFLPLGLGGTVRMTARFSPAWVDATLAAHGPTHLAAVPTMLRMLTGGARDDRPLDILTGGEAVGPELRTAIFARFPEAGIHSIYGLTETGTCDIYLTDRASSPAADTLGFPGEGIEVATDPDTSELLIRSPFAMLGYLDNPSATAETLGDGWLRTGDMAEIAPDGSVALRGRIKELINRGGNKVSPLEVEAIFARHPDVEAVLATGVPDPRIGEAIHLLIVPRGTARPTQESLLDWAFDRSERFKLPDAVHFGQALPLGNTGKADRAALRREILERATLK